MYGLCMLFVSLATRQTSHSQARATRPSVASEVYAAFRKFEFEHCSWQSRLYYRRDDSDTSI